jgi:hypothetical protein
MKPSPRSTASPPASRREERDEWEAAAAHSESRRNADIEIDGHDFRVSGDNSENNQMKRNTGA